MSGRCSGLSYNAWLYFTPRHLLDELVAASLLRWCTNHKTKLLMTHKLRVFLESQWLQEGGTVADYDVPGEDRPTEAQAAGDGGDAAVGCPGGLP